MSTIFRVGTNAHTCTLVELLDANRDDEELAEWACNARPGDYFPNGEGCECLDGGDAE
jgi:hypothetical protein